MPRVSLPSEENSESSWEPIPVGEYAYQVESANFETNQKSGLSKLRVVLICQTDHPYHRSDGEPANTKHRQVWHYFDLQPKSMWAIEAFMDAANVPYTKVLDRDTGKPRTEFDSDEMPGCWVYGYTEQQEWNGRINNRVTKWTKYLA